MWKRILIGLMLCGYSTSLSLKFFFLFLLVDRKEKINRVLLEQNKKLKGKKKKKEF